VGCLLRRPSLFVGLAAQPPPAPISGEPVISAPDPSSHKRARRGEIDNNSGHIEGDRNSPRSEPAAIEARAEEGARPEAPAGAIPSPAAAPETDSTLTGETTPAGATAPLSSATEGAAAGDDAAALVSSDSPSQERMHEVTAEATETTPARAGSLESPGPAARTSPDPRPAPNTQAVVPMAEAGASAATDSLLFRLVSNSGDASQGLLTTRVAGSERGGTLPAPEVGIPDASRGKAPATAAGSGVGSLSSAGQL
jgi:hypothetical protein